MSGLDSAVTRPAGSIAGVAFACFLLSASPVNAQGAALGSAESFGVLAKSAITNTGASAIVGDVGVSIGGAVCGEDFTRGGRTLETLGLGELSKAELQTVLRNGF